MKRTVIILLCMLISVITLGQEKKQYSDEIKGVKVSPPRFIGNEDLLSVLNETQFGSLNDYLMNKIQYPENSKEWKKEGTEVIQFEVTPKGELKDFNIINSLSPEIDQEVIRVLKTTNGLWKPGLNNGKPVAMDKEVSIAFKLENTTDFLKVASKFYATGSKMLLIKERPKLALKNFNKAFTLLPNDKCNLLVRGIAKYELGDKSGACQDWTRIKALGGLASDVYLDKFCEFKGYSEMVNTLDEKK